MKKQLLLISVTGIIIYTLIRCKIPAGRLRRNKGNLPRVRFSFNGRNNFLIMNGILEQLGSSVD